MGFPLLLLIVQWYSNLEGALLPHYVFYRGGARITSLRENGGQFCHFSEVLLGSRQVQLLILL